MDVRMCALVFWTMIVFQPCRTDDTYEALSAVTEHLLGPNSSYNPNIRPLNNQSHLMIVDVIFSIVSLEEIDDVKQSFTMNGFLSMDWTDERIMWNYTHFNGMDYLHPGPNDVWRPRMVLLNTLGDRDMFKDNYSPMVVYSDGYVWWMPGGLFKASCGLDMGSYPFDEQRCGLMLCPMGFTSDHLVFYAIKEGFNFDFFVNNEEWDITKTLVNISHDVAVASYAKVTCIELIIHVKRRTGYYILNVILPVLMLSFLNNFVFLIPDDSGEKIGYGITVLLSVSVFLTTVSAMIPRASNNIPAVTIYLFVLLSFSVVSVLASIATVYLQHADEDETDHLKVQDKYRRAVKKVFGLRQALVKVDPGEEPDKPDQRDKSSSPVIDFDDRRSSNLAPPKKNKYRTVTKHINSICFACSMSFWVVTQVTYFIYVNT